MTDHTTVNYIITRKGEVIKAVEEKILYKDYSTFDRLPDVVKSEAVRVEFERFKREQPLSQ